MSRVTQKFDSPLIHFFFFFNRWNSIPYDDAFLSKNQEVIDMMVRSSEALHLISMNRSLRVCCVDRNAGYNEPDRPK